MANLPIFQDDNKNLMLLQTQWASVLNPAISKPQAQSSVLTNVALANGTTTINHLLGRKLQGWKIVRQRAQATIWDNQDSNTMPTLTLVLVSSAAVVCDIEVF